MAADVHRPLLVGVIAILVGIQAVFAIVFGFALFVERNDAALLDHVSQSSGELGWVGVIAMAVGVVELLVAIGLWRGIDFARIFVGAIGIFQMLGGLYILIAYQGTVRWQGLWQILITALILYLLFNRSAERFFSAG